jgi:hypothetical protein
VTFSQVCDGVGPLTGEVRWNAESDVTPPPAVTGLSVTGSGSTRQVGWTTPAGDDTKASNRARGNYR